MVFLEVMEAETGCVEAGGRQGVGNLLQAMKYHMRLCCLDLVFVYLL